MESYKRIIVMHGLLKTNSHVPTRKFQEKCASTRSTFYRDIETLRDDLGAPLENQRGKGWHYRPDAPLFELPGMWFNQSELFAMLSAHQLLDAMQPGVLARHVAPFRDRLRRLLEKSGHNPADIAQRVRVQTFGARNIDNAIFDAVSGAVLQSAPLNIAYAGRGRDELTRRVIHPYRLINHRHNWYLAAWCDLRDELRYFSLDCIRDSSPAHVPFRKMADVELDRTIGDHFGIFAGGERTWAVLRFSAFAARWIAAEHWHPDQQGRWLPDGLYELRIPYSNPQELIMEILRHGPEVEVLDPPALRAQVVERLKAALKKYERV